MRFRLEFDMNNSAFEPDAATEVGRILRKITTAVEDDGEFGAPIRDVNGNRIGVWQVVE